MEFVICSVFTVAFIVVRASPRAVGSQLLPVQTRGLGRLFFSLTACCHDLSMCECRFSLLLFRSDYRIRFVANVGLLFTEWHCEDFEVFAVSLDLRVVSYLQLSNAGTNGHSRGLSLQVVRHKYTHESSKRQLNPCVVTAQDKHPITPSRSNHTQQ